MKKLLALLKQLGAKEEDIKAVQDEIDAEIETAKESEVAGLKKKNLELLKKNKELSGEEGNKVSELEEKLEKLVEENTKLSKAVKTADEKRAQAEKERDEKVSASESAISQLLIDGGLSSSLAGKVKPAHMGAVKMLLAKNFIVEADETNNRKAVALIKDADGKEQKVGVDDFLKNWFATDVGKEFMLVPGGTGGGAPGSGGGSGVSGKKSRYEELKAKKELSSAEEYEYIALSRDPEAIATA